MSLARVVGPPATGLKGSQWLEVPYAVTGANHAKQRLDVLLPKTGTLPANGKWPVVMVVHPGGWKSGDKSLPGQTHPFTDLRLNGIAIVTINHRLSGDAVWPAHIHDAWAAMRWIWAEGHKYHLDKDHVGIWGISSGGHLGALVALTNGFSSALSGSQGNNSATGVIKCCVTWFAPLNFPTEDAEFALQSTPNGRGWNVCSTSSEESELFGGIGTGLNPCSGSGLTKSTEASAHTYLHVNAPFFRCEHGDTDDTVPLKQSENFKNALNAVIASRAEYHLHVGAGHGAGGGSVWATNTTLRANTVAWIASKL